MRLMIGVMLLASPALASTPAAWQAGNAAARAACVKAAGFAAPVASAPVIFSDTGGAKTAILVTGRYRQPFMHNAKGQMLCLYDRGAKRAEVQEAKGWTAPR